MHLILYSETGYQSCAPEMLAIRQFLHIIDMKYKALSLNINPVAYERRGLSYIFVVDSRGLLQGN